MARKKRQHDEAKVTDEISGAFVHLKNGEREAFLCAYSTCGNVTSACKAAGVHRNSHYNWMHDPEYAAAFEIAKRYAVDTLRREAWRRATEGVDEPQFYQGQVCGAVRKYSDTLLIFLLKGVAPEEFRERYEHSGPGGGPIQHVHAKDNSDDLLAEIERVRERRLTEAREGNAN